MELRYADRTTRLDNGNVFWWRAWNRERMRARRNDCKRQHHSRQLGATSVVWSVFDTQGRWVTDVSVPFAWQIVDIGHDYILTIETNELDVERVRMYGLTRGTAAR